VLEQQQAPGGAVAALQVLAFEQAVQVAHAEGDALAAAVGEHHDMAGSGGDVDGGT